LHPHASSSHYFGADIRRCPAHASKGSRTRFVAL
jgi:hypothetical protein